jgi:predicted MFS family arabinose efflux permease
MVTPMVLALVATHLPLEQRASAVGWITASPGIAAMVGAPIISILARVGGWRGVFLGLGFTISFVSLVLAIKGIPAPERSHHSVKSQGQYWEAFKEVFANRSALACLLGTALIVGAYAANQVYFLSFFREQFALSVEFTSILLVIGALSFVLGSLFSRKVIAQFGRKPTSIFAACLMGGSIIAYMNVANFGLAILLSALSAVFGGIVAATSSGLTLEQVPQYRGTMMSMHYTAWSLGTAVGTAVGGAALLLYSYGMLGLILGSFGLIAALVFYAWAHDPTIET